MSCGFVLDGVDVGRAYEPSAVEGRLYDWWEESGFFAPDEQGGGEPFVISIPPPNVTGELHLGHAMFVTLEDVIIRWRRMQGYRALWVPGTDHAGIATQLQVERLLREEGTSREEVGREEFLRRTWEWKERYGGQIHVQFRELGASCDWSRERFTLDDGLCRAVHTAFKRLYDDGLMYRGTYLVNWSPNLRTAVSDLEVEYVTREGYLWYVRYPLVPLGDDAECLPGGAWGSGVWAEGATEYIIVATTRPETILGDTAVAVHPEDERYAAMVGREVLLPGVGRCVPIVADEYVDREFGTGAVKITPAHDANDYEVGKRHNLPMVNIMHVDATLNDAAGRYAGLERFAARKALVADLEREGLLVKVEPHTLNVGISQRGGEVIEPLLSEQWFVRTGPLAKLALDAVREGRTRIIPEHFERVYSHWMENIRDWCVSRQLWWGHRIPVWYMPDGTVVVPGPGEAVPDGAVQDADVLDTWFSSGLWPFSTLGWPDDTEDMRVYYPTSVMETGYDILFFWVARMMMLGCYLTGVAPFHTIYLHGLVRDEYGRKMSKTCGNVVDPREVMRQYGTDALRFTLATSGTPGQDVNLNPQRIEAGRNFANKIWNLTRYVLGACGGVHGMRCVGFEDVCTDSLLSCSLADRWILSRYGRLVGDVGRLMEGYEFGEAGRQVRDFLWAMFADWYVEMAKVQLGGDASCQRYTAMVLFAVLEGCLRLLHPFMPFVTEAAWQFLWRGCEDGGDAVSIMRARYPVGGDGLVDARAEEDFGLVQDIVTGIRNVRNEYRVEAGRWVAATVVAGERASLVREQAGLVCRLARVDAGQLVVVESLAERPVDVATLVFGAVEVFLPLAGMVDVAAERVRLGRELAEAEADVRRREGRLGSADFVAKAPAHVVQRERDGLADSQARVGRLRGRLDALK